MPFVDLKNTRELQRYNDFIANTEGANITQTTFWGEVKSGWSYKALYIEKNGEIRAAILILIKKLPLIPYYLFYSPKGPVCDFNDRELLKELLKEVGDYAKKKKAFMLKFDPELLEGFDYMDKLSGMHLNIRCKNKSLKDYIQPKHNMVLNLENKTEEELLQEFSSKTRYNINLADRKGVKVFYDETKAAVPIFYNIHKVTGERDGFIIRNQSYFENLIETLPKDSTRIYYTKHEEDFLSAAITINFGGKSWYMYGASSNVKRNLMPSYIMQWEMIKWALSRGMKKYDFGGVFEFTKENGLFKFKEGFCRTCGMTEYIGEVDIVYNKFLYFLFETILPKLQNLKRKLKKR